MHQALQTGQPTSKPIYHIGIDARLAGLKHGGIGRYIENLIRELLKLQPQHIHWHFFFFNQEQTKEVLGDSSHLTDQQTTGNRPTVSLHYIPIRHYTLTEQIQLPSIFTQANLDLLHIPHFNIPFMYQGNILVTIHDLLWHEYTGPDVTTLAPWQYWIKHHGYKWLTYQAVSKARKILVPAETVKKTVIRYYPNTEAKIVVTPEGVSDTFSKNIDTKFAQSSITKHTYLMYIGSLYPHKNITIVLDSLKKLPNYHLILIGARDVFADKTLTDVLDRDLEDRVHFLGYQTDEVITGLLKHAVALVQPSLSEGFGLTGLEAMASEAVVLCSDIPIFREVYQDGAEFFDPKKVNSFVTAVKNIEKKQHRQTLIERSKSIVKQYSWQKMAQQTLASYMDVLHE